MPWQAAPGEEKAADEEAAATWRADVLNADKTACFCQLLLAQTLHFKGEECKNSNKSKVGSYDAPLMQCKWQGKT